MVLIGDRATPPGRSRTMVPPRGGASFVLLLTLVLLVAGGASAAKSAPPPPPSSSWDCDSCPVAVVPVCALDPASGVSLTLSHRCYAECQGLQDVRPGSCEDMLNSGAARGPVASASPSATNGKKGAAAAFAASVRGKHCKPRKSDVSAYQSEGLIFVGCTDGARSGGPSLDAPAAGAAEALLRRANQDTDTVVLAMHRYNQATGHLYMRTAQFKPAALRTAGALDGIVTSTTSASASPDNTTLPDPAGAGNSSAPATRKLLQTDNRWRVSDTTAWPWPSMAYLTYNSPAGGSFRCSGSIISSDDLLTAAHCVIDSVSGTAYKDFSVVPGKNGASEPYGRWGWTASTWWSTWVGAQYNGQFAVTAGSAYIDVGMVHLDRPIGWWVGLYYQCGWRSIPARACGFPADRGTDAICSDGTTNGIDYCDGTSDFVISNNLFHTGGQSGGPLYDRNDGRVTGVVSGTNGNGNRMYAALDTFNWRLIFEPSWQTSLWSRSYNFRSSGYGLVRSNMNGKCLDAPQWGNGVRVHMWDCHSGSNQQWRRPSANDLSLQTYNNYCLDVPANYNGAPVTIWQCHGGDNQKWFYDRNGRLRPWSSPTRCVDISGANSANGAQLVIWDCHGGSNQKWY